MSYIEPINQAQLFGLDKFMNELILLNKKNKLPNKILLSGQKGIGKSTLAYHFINYVLSIDENYKYDIDNFKINPNNHSFKTINNKSNLNFFLIDIDQKNKFIDIKQVRELILRLNKSSLNSKPRFILIDNIEYLNVNSVNALLKVLEEPSSDIHFILINNNKKILPTLLSRCINFKISLTNNKCIEISNKLLDNNLELKINTDLLNYYLSPGNIYILIKFAIENDYDLKNLNLKEFLKKIIGNNDYKNNNISKNLIFELIEFYFRKIYSRMDLDVYDKYKYFLKRISETKKFNLDEESLFMEFEDKVLNG